jgi:hypothetical protein
MIFAFKCSVAGTDWDQIVNHTTNGKAKSEYHRQVSDVWPDVKFTDIRAYKLGPAHTSERFVDNANYRGMPDVKCGQRVRVGESRGYIVGHNSSANFNVLFDEDDKRWPGTTLNVHPTEIVLITADAGGEG